jgi:LmbE family N-acetylglucosaminyl deacetylase
MTSEVYRHQRVLALHETLPTMTRLRTRRPALLATALLSIALLAPVLAQPPANQLLPIDATTSLLVVSPHPDDETLCCAGVIQRVLAAGGRVSVVWITSGDGSILSLLIVEKTLPISRARTRDLANRRMQEARTATSLLGVPGTRQFFLGYPDGGVSKRLGDRNLERDFTTVLEQVRPTLILAPSPKDTHPDHRASGLLAITVLARRGESAKARFWIVHGGEGWPSPRAYMPSIPLFVPPTGRGLDWSVFDLTDLEVARKRSAIDAYRSQLQVMEPFLVSFVRTSELYSSTP